MYDVKIICTHALCGVVGGGGVGLLFASIGAGASRSCCGASYISTNIKAALASPLMGATPLLFIAILHIRFCLLLESACSASSTSAIFQLWAFSLSFPAQRSSSFAYFYASYVYLMFIAFYLLCFVPRFLLLKAFSRCLFLFAISSLSYSDISLIWCELRMSQG